VRKRRERENYKIVGERKERLDGGWSFFADEICEIGKL